MEKRSGQTGRDAAERRCSYRLRLAFDTAFPMLERFFDPAHGWSGSSLSYLAYGVVRNNFSELNSKEIHTLIIAAHRAYIDRFPERSAHLPRPAELSMSRWASD